MNIIHYMLNIQIAKQLKTTCFLELYGSSIPVQKMSQRCWGGNDCEVMIPYGAGKSFEISNKIMKNIMSMSMKKLIFDIFSEGQGTTFDSPSTAKGALYWTSCHPNSDAMP